MPLMQVAENGQWEILGWQDHKHFGSFFLAFLQQTGINHGWFTYTNLKQFTKIIQRLRPCSYFSSALLHPPYCLLLYLPSGGAGQLPEEAPVTPDRDNQALRPVLLHASKPPPTSSCTAHPLFFLYSNQPHTLNRVPFPPGHLCPVPPSPNMKRMNSYIIKTDNDSWGIVQLLK